MASLHDQLNGFNQQTLKQGETNKKDINQPKGPDKIFSTLSYDVPEVKKDIEGYTTSFSTNQAETYKQFFDTYGFVVINDVLSENERNDTIKEIWHQLESNKWGYNVPNIDRNDPSTWDDKSWPTGLEVGFFGDLAVTPLAFENRQRESVYNVFSTLLQQKDLWVSLDRYGIMRPTRQIPQGKLPEDPVRSRVDPIKDVKSVDKPEWASTSAGDWVHWDLNPWRWSGSGKPLDPYKFKNFMSENNGNKQYGHVKVQGLINLGDSKHGAGGFWAVPGFHKHIKDFCEKTKDTEYAKQSSELTTITYVPNNSPIIKKGQKITARPGSIIIWNSELPHCNQANDSNTFRLVQYIKMLPQHTDSNDWIKRTELVKEIIPKDFKVSSLGEKLLGLSSW